MSAAPPRLKRDGDPHAALASRCAPFSETADLLSGYELLGRSDIPWPCHDLLVHHDHMTTVLAARHGQAVTLHVLNARQSGETYGRAIRVSRP